MSMVSATYFEAPGGERWASYPNTARQAEQLRLTVLQAHCWRFSVDTTDPKILEAWLKNVSLEEGRELRLRSLPDFINHTWRKVERGLRLREAQAAYYREIVQVSRGRASSRDHGPQQGIARTADDGRCRRQEPGEAHPQAHRVQERVLRSPYIQAQDLFEQYEAPEPGKRGSRFDAEAGLEKVTGASALYVGSAGRWRGVSVLDKVPSLLLLRETALYLS